MHKHPVFTMEDRCTLTIPVVLRGGGVVGGGDQFVRRVGMPHPGMQGELISRLHQVIDESAGASKISYIVLIISSLLIHGPIACMVTSFNCCSTCMYYDNY